MTGFPPKLRVLVVDDSAFMRQIIAGIINACSDMEVVATARNGQEAVSKTRELRPDLITLDIEMPMMDGLVALAEIMTTCPTPVVMVSSLTVKGASLTLQALEGGAIDFVTKPDRSVDTSELTAVLPQKLRTAAGVRRRPVRRELANGIVSSLPWAYDLVLVGCSTGGPAALQKIIPALPPDFPSPIVIAQHIPVGFTRPMAERLNHQSRVTVVEAQHHQELRAACVYIAPAGSHTVVQREGSRAILSVLPPEHSPSPFRPSVNVLFSSAVSFAPRLLAIVLTGMGQDGLEGARELKKVGAHIMAESEETAVVYGMPRVVVEAGLTERVLSLNDIAVFLASLGKR